MTWMNEGEVREAVNRHRDHPQLGLAARALEAYMDAVNSCSDGWPYWTNGSKAADKLMTYLQENRMTRSPVPLGPIQKELTDPIRRTLKKYAKNFGNFTVAVFNDILQVEGPPPAISEKLRALAVEAESVQNASNIIGISKRFPAVLDELREELQKTHEHVTPDLVGTHPIAQVWVDKLCSLAQVYGMNGADAHARVAKLIASPVKREAVATS